MDANSHEWIRGDLRPLAVGPVRQGSEADLFFAEGPDNSQYAVKIYHRAPDESLRTAEVLAGLPGERLLIPLERGQWHGRLVEVMPYLADGSLAELIKKGPLPVSDVRRLLVQITEGLEQLHRAGVQHRDMKPTNILIRSKDPLEIVLADFGCAAVTSDTMLTGGAGTLFYSAPESLTGLYSQASDYWSLGIILIEALTGALIADIWRNDPALSWRIIQGKVSIPDSIPNEWRPLIKGLLNRDHYKRWRAPEIHSWLDQQKDKDATANKPGLIVVLMLVASLLLAGMTVLSVTMVIESQLHPVAAQNIGHGPPVNQPASRSGVTQSAPAPASAPGRVAGWIVNIVTAAAWLLAAGCVLLGIAHVLAGVPHGSGAMVLGAVLGVFAYYLPRLLG